MITFCSRKATAVFRVGSFSRKFGGVFDIGVGLCACFVRSSCMWQIAWTGGDALTDSVEPDGLEVLQHTHWEREESFRLKQVVHCPLRGDCWLNVYKGLLGIDVELGEEEAYVADIECNASGVSSAFVRFTKFFSGVGRFGKKNE